MTDKTPNLGWPQDQRDLDAREALQAAAPSLPAGDGLTDAKTALQFVVGCWEAAEVEGLADAISDAKNVRSPAAERLADLLERRISFGIEHARAILAAPRQPGEMGAGVQTQDALRWIMRQAESAKEACSDNPESPAAIRNGKLAGIATAAAQALGLVRGPSYAASAQQDEPTPAQPISDAMMDLVDRLGSEAANVDPRAWRHLLVYAPEAAQQDEREADAKALKDASEWLLDVMGDWDFTIPNGAFDKIVVYIAKGDHNG